MLYNFIFSRKKLHLSLLGATLFSIVSCNISKPYYDTDGIYNSDPVFVNDTYHHGKYYTQYFKDLKQDSDTYFTDIDNYSSYNNGEHYGSWGDNTSENIVYYTPSFGMWGWGYPYSWGFNSFYGWGYPYGWGFNSFYGWGYPYGWGFNNFYGWGYPYYGNQNNYSYSNNSRFNRTVIPASSRNTSRYTGFTQNLRNSNTRVTPRRTISQPISEISRTSTLSNNRTSINRNLNNTPTINRNEGNRNFNLSNSRSYNNSSMSIGGSRGFNGGSSRGVSSGGGRR